MEKTSMKSSNLTEAHFWRYVRKSKACWIWIGPMCKTKKLGVFHSGRTLGARHFSWEMHKRTRYSGRIFVTCGNPACVNPKHLSTEKPLVDRFWERVKKTTSCWLWTGNCVPFGYGLIRFGGKPARTHRVSWMIHRGEIPKGMLVLHRCDNPKCVNPNHLFLGTDKDNLADMASKNRSPHGECNGMHKLRKADVVEIYKLSAAGCTQRQIAKRFLISQQHVSGIVRREYWRRI